MKIKNEKLMGLGNKPIVLENEEVTFASICIGAVLAKGEQETGTMKFSNYQLAEKLAAAKVDEDIELTIEEAKVIKDKVGTHYTAVLVGPIYKLLEKIE